MFFDTDEYYKEVRDEEDQSAFLAASQQFYEEVAYQEALAISFPQDERAIFAANWLRTQKAW